MFHGIDDKLWGFAGRSQITERTPHLTLISKVANQRDDHCTRRPYLARDLLESGAVAGAENEATGVLREVVSGTTAEFGSAAGNEHATNDVLSLPIRVAMYGLGPGADWPQRLRASQPVQQGNRTKTDPTPGFRGSPCPIQPTLAGLTAPQQLHASVPRSSCWYRAFRRARSIREMSSSTGPICHNERLFHWTRCSRTGTEASQSSLRYALSVRKLENSRAVVI